MNTNQTDELIDKRTNLMKEYHKLQHDSTIEHGEFNKRTEEIEFEFSESLIESMKLAISDNKPVDKELIVNTLYEAFKFEDFFDRYYYSDNPLSCLRECYWLSKLLSVMFERMKSAQFDDKLDYIKHLSTEN